jgi:predicted GH43/DUF377 family glycosyl hydrolase
LAPGFNSEEHPMSRFVYATFKTYERAAACLEDMFATGDVFACEDPRIERRGKFYVITLPAC